MTYLDCKTFFDYYLSLEKDLFKTETYVAFHENNFKVFSIEFAKQLLSVCSEVEAVLKKICYYLNPERKYETIKEYKDCITEHLKYFSSESVYFKKPHLLFNPWSLWNESKPLDWWQDYNCVKHRRAELDEEGLPNFYRANLKNLLNAMAALFVAEEYLFYLYEKKQMDAKNMKSYVLQTLKSEELTMREWQKSYLSFQGNSWCDLSVLDRIMENRD